MKKAVMILAVAALLACQLFAADNNQKIYSVDDTIWRDISDIYVMTGHAQPSSTGPWSGDELLKMMNKISRNDVPAFMQDTYDKVMKRLDPQYGIQLGDFGGITFTGLANLEFYGHTNSDSPFTRKDVSGYEEQLFVGRDNWMAPTLRTNAPMVGFEWETWAAGHFYATFDFGLYNSYHCAKEVGSTPLSSNLFLFQNMELEPGELDANFPYRAFVSAGGENWSIEAGRERLSWGVGTSGNLTISNNLPYHNVARFTTYGDSYKYTFLTSFYPHKMNYYNNYDNDCESGFWFSGHNNGYGSRVDGLYMYIAHRMEGRFLDDKLSATLTEAIIYSSETNHIDLAVFNPVFIFHNNYIAANSNSTLEFELDYTPIKGLNIYAQALVDEFAIPFIENQPSASNSGTPNCYAFLFGAKYQTSLADGLLTANAEFAKIDPYVYLRDSESNTGDKYSIDYVVAVREWSTSLAANSDYGGITYSEYVLGYQYGPDCMVLNGNVNWKKDRLSLTLNLLSMSHGTHDLWTERTDVGGCSDEYWKESAVSPTTVHPSKNYRYSNASSRDSVWKMTDIGIGATWNALEGMDVFAQADLVLMKNAFNMNGQNDSDFQVVVGVNYKW